MKKKKKEADYDYDKDEYKLDGDKQKELDSIARSGEAGLRRTETKKQKYYRQDYTWPLYRDEGMIYPPSDEEDDRVQDIRLSVNKFASKKKKKN